MKLGSPRGNTETQRSRLKRRCSKNKCRKKAMDIIEREYLCRIHSPLRQGYIGDKK